MVICEKHKFIYLRIPKNASSSLAQFFVKNFCTSGDIYTEVNDCGIKTTNVKNEVVKKYKHQYRFIHLTLQEIVDNKVITRESAHNKDVISVIRNPFDRQLSLYFFLKRGRNPSVDEFRTMFENGCHRTDGSNKILQTEYALLDGKDLGTWWNYDSLDKHLNDFVAEKGINPTLKLNNFKGKFKPKDKNIVDQYYDQVTKDAVKRYYEKDFEKYYELTGVEA